MASGSQVFVTVIAPLIGMLICNYMWITPLPVMLEARYTRNMGETNPIPFVVTILNCVGWTIYACLTYDFFLFFSNIFGTALGMYYTIISLTIMAKRSADGDFSDQYIRLEGLLIFAFFFWSLMGMVAGTAFLSASDPKLEGTSLIGNLSCAFSIAYYAAPMSTMVEVVSKRDSSSLYLPMITVNLVNGVMWSLYGFFARNDINLWGPNLLGTALTLVQVAMCFTFPAKNRAEGKSFAHIWLLLQGKIPPSTSAPTSEKVMKSERRSGASEPLSRKVDDFDDEDVIV